MGAESILNSFDTRLLLGLFTAFKNKTEEPSVPRCPERLIKLEFTIKNPKETDGTLKNPKNFKDP